MAFDLVLDNGVWVVAQRFNYPVNDKQLFQLLDQLGKARLIEKKTTLSKHHAALGLVEDSSDSASVLMFQGDTLIEACCDRPTSQHSAGNICQVSIR